jgi:hypothetical protein
VNVLKFAVLFIFYLMLPTGVLADTKPTEKPATKPATKVKAEKAKPAAPAKKVEKAKPATMAKADTTKPVMPAKKKANKAAVAAKKDAKKTKVPAKAKKKKPEGLVIGKNLKVTMPLAEAIKLLGIPGSISINRGTESKLDSISIAYANHGIVLHSLNGKKHIEALEILPQFKGSFAEGIKIGEKFTVLIEKYGVPQSMNASMAKYPKKGMYFSLKENVLVAAHVFRKNSEILSHQLYKNR